MTEPVSLGFGDERVAGLVRSDAGVLICRGGETSAAARPRVDTRADDAGWQAAGADGLDLAFEPVGQPAAFTDGTRDWLCRVHGTAGGGPVDCLGSAVVEANPPRTWKRVGLGRALAAWIDEDLAISLRSRRPARAKHHEAEDIQAFVLRGSPPEPQPIEDPRLSTAYDADGRQRRAGLELWETEEADYPLRLAGEAIGSGTLALDGGLLLHTAFMRWRCDRRTGSGRYDIVTAAP